MGGDIVVAQRRGGGTTFTLTVTLARAKAVESGRFRRATPMRSRAPAQALRILSVEDNPFGRVVLNAILTELGHQAEFIGRGEAAAERIAQGAFDAVLMDMVLPGIDGIEAIRRIRQLERRRSAASRSSGYRAAATTRRHRAPPAPTPFWSSLCLHGL